MHSLVTSKSMSHCPPWAPARLWCRTGSARFIVASVVAALLLPASVEAASIEPSVLTRRLQVDYFVSLDSSYAYESWSDYDQESMSGEGVFDSSLSISGGGWEGTEVGSGAEQTSKVLLGAGLIEATGSAFGAMDSVSGSGGEGECCEWWVYEDAVAAGVSSLYLLFDVLEPVAFSIDFTGATPATPHALRGAGSFSFGLYQGSPLVSGAWGTGAASLVIDESGVLMPGRYLLDVEASSDGATSSFDLAMVVPEPGTALLLGAGLGLLALRRPRRPRSSRPPVPPKRPSEPHEPRHPEAGTWTKRASSGRPVPPRSTCCRRSSSAGSSSGS